MQIHGYINLHLHPANVSTTASTEDTNRNWYLLSYKTVSQGLNRHKYVIICNKIKPTYLQN